MGILCPFPSRSCSAYIPKCCNPWSPHIAPRLPYRKKARNILYLIKYTDFSSPFSPELVPLATPHKTSLCPVPSSAMPKPLFPPVMFGYFLFFFVILGLFFLSCHPRTSVARSGDLWIFGSSPNMTVRKISPTMAEREESHARV